MDQPTDTALELLADLADAITDAEPMELADALRRWATRSHYRLTVTRGRPLDGDPPPVYRATIEDSHSNASKPK